MRSDRLRLSFTLTLCLVASGASAQTYNMREVLKSRISTSTSSPSTPTPSTGKSCGAMVPAKSLSTRTDIAPFPSENRPLNTSELAQVKSICEANTDRTKPFCRVARLTYGHSYCGGAGGCYVISVGPGPFTDISVNPSTDYYGTQCTAN